MSERPRTIVRALGFVSLLTDVASDMIYPLLPAFVAHTLGGGPAALGMVEGLAQATASLTQIYSGRWSDRTKNRKRLVVFGYAIAAIARPLVGWATHVTHVLAIRVTDRIGKGLRGAPRDALIADLVPASERGRAFGLQRAMDNAGAFLGPLVAAFLLKYVVSEERSVFLLAAIPGILAVILLIVAVPNATGSTPRPTETAVAPPPGGRLKALLGIFVLFTLANSTDAFLLLRAGDAGVSPWQIPLLWSLLHAVKALLGVPGGAIADRYGRVPAIVAGWLVYAAAYLGFAYVETAAEMTLLIAIYAIYYALTEGAERALIADLVPAESRGRAFGLFHAALGLAALPSSFLFGLWWRLFGARGAFLIGAALALSATVALALWHRRRPRGD